MRRAALGSRSLPLLVPEIIQTSAMDCGPAVLKSLLEGFGIRVGYQRLRDACGTDVDGTSIDALEDLAGELGLDAEQLMLPLDHLLCAEARALPCILVVSTPLGLTHFVVCWRVHGPWVQLMDPVVGRRWVRRRELLGEAHRHSLAVPASAWRAWASSGEFLGTLAARLRALRAGSADRQRLLDAGLADPSWRTLAALDAAIRMAASLVAARALPAGAPCARLIETQVACATGAQRELADAIPERYWSVHTHGSDPEADPSLRMRGVVVLRALRRRAAPAGHGASEPSAAQLGPVPLGDASPRPWRELWRSIRADGIAVPSVLTAGLALASGAVMLESLLFLGVLDLTRRLPLLEQRLAALAALLAFGCLVLLLELPLQAGILTMGRRLEMRTRIWLLGRIRALGDDYFRTRLASDLAERAYGVHVLRELPLQVFGFARESLRALLGVAGVIWLAPEAAAIACAAAAVAIGMPLAFLSMARGRELRTRSHGGALARLHLDTLLGSEVVQSHGAERPLRREHEALLVEWARAFGSEQRIKRWSTAVTQACGYLLAVWIVLRHLARTGASPELLLLAYWSLGLPLLGTRLADVAARLARQRNALLRLLEPLGLSGPAHGRLAGEGARAEIPATAALSPALGVQLRWIAAAVSRAGCEILSDVSVEIPAGAHVAVVGPSGAGKSSLAGMLLGWQPLARGALEIDGRPGDPARLAELRGVTTWVDPSVQLWQRSLLENLLYGADTQGMDRDALGAAIQAARLRELLGALPEGLQTDLGEGGALVSGGEGQRVRLARALLQAQPRLVILDEPFRGLEREQRRELTARARTWWRSATLLHITHDLAETLDFDRVLVMDRGRLVESGPPAELAARPTSRYRALLDAERRLDPRFRAHSGWRRLLLAERRLREVANP